jgi:hypothetical protein
MLRGSRKKTIERTAVSAAALARELAADRRFRKRLLSALEHSTRAGRRARDHAGAGTARRLVGDPVLLGELKGVSDDLRDAYHRLETKRRSHKLRTLLLVALASLALPAVRRRVGALLGGSSANPGSGGRSVASQPALEDLTKEELYARAQEAGIPGRSEMSKEQLVAALRANARGSA